MLIEHLPAESATVRAARGEDAAWSLECLLLAGIHDVLAAANWQRAGNNNAPRPKPIPRPGVKPAGERRLGRAQPVSAIRARLARRGT